MAKKAAKAAPAAAAPSASKEKKAASKPATKNEILGVLSEKSGVEKKKIAALLDALGELIGKELGKKGPGVFTLPGLVKLRVVRKPATKAKQGTNPFTKQPMLIKAKPARNAIRAVPLKSLKELV